MKKQQLQNWSSCEKHSYFVSISIQFEEFFKNFLTILQGYAAENVTIGSIG